MNYGNIHGNTKCGKVYRYLLARLGWWQDAWSLTLNTESTAISTRISEVRQQLPASLTLEHRVDGGKHFYRLMPSGIEETKAEDKDGQSRLF